MVWLRRVWTWGSSLVVGAFVAVYLGTLLAHNFFNLLPESFDDEETTQTKRELDNETNRLLSATGTTQRWNMFAPNVGTLSYSPIVVIVFKDGSRVSLHSGVEPDLPGWEGDSLIPNDVEGDQRLYEWRFHIGDGRIRKFESNAAKTSSSWTSLRTYYVRWRANRWLEDHPERKRDVQRLELWRTAIRHPGYGRELSCESVEIMPIYPRYDKLWPVVIDPTFPLYRN